MLLTNAIHYKVRLNIIWLFQQTFVAGINTRYESHTGRFGLHLCFNMKKTSIVLSIKARRVSMFVEGIFLLLSIFWYFLVIFGDFLWTLPMFVGGTLSGDS